MKLFRLPKNNRRFLDQETALQRLLRLLLILLLFGGVLWGFWMNNQRRLDIIRDSAQRKTVAPQHPQAEQTGRAGTLPPAP